jgi:hypothetical protein
MLERGMIPAIAGLDSVNSSVAADHPALEVCDLHSLETAANIPILVP